MGRHKRVCRIRRIAKMTASFFLEFGSLPHGLSSALIDYSAEDIVRFNIELGKCSRSAAEALLRNPEEADNPPAFIGPQPPQAPEPLQAALEYERVRPRWHYERMYQ